MKIRIKRLHQNAVIPTYAKHGDAGMDLTATSKSYDENNNVVYGTALAFIIFSLIWVKLDFTLTILCWGSLFIIFEGLWNNNLFRLVQNL